MEVLLKKTKINRSIIKQSVSKHLKDCIELKLLGWCSDNKEKLLVFYDEVKHVIITSQYITEGHFLEYGVRDGFSYYTKEAYMILYPSYKAERFGTEEARVAFLKLRHQINTEAESLGQIYL